MDNYNCSHSKFDIDKHADTYINYLEVCIAPNGDIHYAVPSHTRFLELKLIEKLGKEEYDRWVSEVCLDCNWLLALQDKLGGYVSVWNTFYEGTPNASQMDSLLKLYHKRYTRGSGTLYQGSLDRRIY